MYRRFIAVKYLTSRFITFAALLTVSSGVAVLIVILSVMEGFLTDLEDRIRGTSADIRVEAMSLVGLKDPVALEREVEGVPGVKEAAPYIETLSMFQPGAESGSQYFFLGALDLSSEEEAAVLSKYLESARDRVRRAARNPAIDLRLNMLHDQPVDPKVLISRDWIEKVLRDKGGFPGSPPPLPFPVFAGTEAMEYLGLFPGRTFELTSYSPVTNRAVSGNFVVVGVFQSRDYQYDTRTLLLPLSAGLDFLELRDPQTGRNSVSGLRVFLAPGEDLDRVAKAITAALVDEPFVRVRTWREEKATLLRAVRIEKAVVGIILGALILFAGFMIFIILTVQVVEKTRDLGVLQSLGSTSLGIARIYFMVGVGICLVGTVLGAIVGVAFSLSLDTIQRWIYLLVGFELFPRNVYYIDNIPVRLAPVDLLFIILPTVLASLVASVIPAYRAARKDPVVALRYE